MDSSIHFYFFAEVEIQLLEVVGQFPHVSSLAPLSMIAHPRPWVVAARTLALVRLSMTISVAELVTTKTSASSRPDPLPSRWQTGGEELSDYESRFRILVRKVEKALTAVSWSDKMPSEVFGWLLLNVCMKLDLSDTANVKAKASTYALDDVLSTLNTMWSGGSLAQRDAELRRWRKGSRR